MSRKKFIESHNATCKNWNWSWSFVNHEEKFIIFGAWDTNTNGDCALIFSEIWSDNKSRKPLAINESREHIRLIEEEQYDLKTFQIVQEEFRDKNGLYKTKIKSFTPKLEDKNLFKVGQLWYAKSESNEISYNSRLENHALFPEGSVKQITVNTFERSKKARKKCIEFHGCICIICNIDFGKKYGPLAEGLIHVHHKISLAEIGNEYEVDPIKDLVPVCPNCHAVIHRTKPALSVKQVIELLNSQKRVNNQ